MTRTIAYSVGKTHAMCGLPMSKTLFKPDTSWDAQQYRQGYIDGGVALQNDIERERLLGKQIC